MSLAAAPGRHVYLVRSSLQFLLATALAADERQRSGQACRLLFLPDLPEPGLWLRATQDWPESPFDRVVPLPARSGSAQVRRGVRVAIDEARPLSLTVFNDREEAGQTALIATARRFAQARRCCAEDGSLAYSGYVFRSHGASTRLRQTLRLGRHWSNVRVLGTHPLVQRFIALHPQLLRPELRALQVEPFPAQALASPALRSLARSLCQDTGFDPRTVPAGATLLTLGHSDYAQRNPDYAALVAACTRRFAGRRERLFVKYHPRETQPDFLGLCGDGAREIPRALPAECLYLALRDRPLTIVGGMSTTLLTAGLLLPQARCVALAHASDAGDAWDRQLLQALHITPLADTQAIDAWFDAGSDAP